MPDQSDVLIYAVGDLHPNRDNPESIVALVAPALKRADLRFGQLEAVLSEERIAQVYRGDDFEWVDPKNVNALTCAGFDVISFASNHCLNMGQKAFADTIDLLRQSGITVVGVGKNIAEARQPAIIERKGARIAFLAYCSVIPPGYEAKPNIPGLAPIRVATYYEPPRLGWQPGLLPKVITIPDKADVEAMREDVRKARSQADVLIVSMHWGLVYDRFLLAMYEREVGHAAVDAGADLIIGHHAHVPKPIEVYKGKVIFYSVGNFAFDFPIGHRARNFGRERPSYGWQVDPEYPNYAFHPDARNSTIATCTISDKKISRVGFLPVMINKQSQPEILPRSDKRSSYVLEFIEENCQRLEFDTSFSWDGDEVVINIP